MQLPLSNIWQPAPVASKNLVVVLHGRGDSAHGFTWLQKELGIDSFNFLLLNAPNSYYTGFSWYDLPPRQHSGIIASRELLEAVFRELPKNGYPPERTFLFGFSQGCLMTLEFGARFSHRLAGYVGISGYCHDPDALLKEMNPEVNQGDWLITHGTEDELLPVERTRGQIQKLITAGFAIDYREYVKSHTIDPERELHDIREWMKDRIPAHS